MFGSTTCLYKSKQVVLPNYNHIKQINSMQHKLKHINTIEIYDPFCVKKTAKFQFVNKSVDSLFTFNVNIYSNNNPVYDTLYITKIDNLILNVYE